MFKNVRVFFAGLLFFVVAIIFIANNFIIVSDGVKSYGIIEDKVFGKPIKEFVMLKFRSAEFKKYTEAEDAVNLVLFNLTNLGPKVFENEKLIKHLTQLATTAFQNANTIPDTYLAQSNEELPFYYKKHFLEALRLWSIGLENEDKTKIKEGILHYNLFLEWIKKHKSSDFKNLK